MKTIVTVAVAFAALAVPSLASAEQMYYDPSESTFVAGTLKAVPTPNNDADRYTQEVTRWDPSEGEFATVKVAATPVIATHDAVQANTVVKRVWDPSEGEFTEVNVAN